MVPVENPFMDTSSPMKTFNSNIKEKAFSPWPTREYVGVERQTYLYCCCWPQWYWNRLWSIVLTFERLFVRVFSPTPMDRNSLSAPFKLPGWMASMVRLVCSLDERFSGVDCIIFADALFFLSCDFGCRGGSSIPCLGSYVVVLSSFGWFPYNSRVWIGRGRYGCDPRH